VAGRVADAVAAPACRESDSTAGGSAQRDVARRSGYSAGYVSEVLRGRKRPSPEAAEAIAQALGGTPNDVQAARTYAERMRDSPVRRPSDRSPKQDPRRRETTWPCRVGVVPAVADCRQARDLSADLARDSPGTEVPEPTRVLTGLGGVGKTQLACSHALDLWERGQLDLLLWANATHDQAIVTAYAQAARAVTGFDDADDAVAARRFLSWAASTDRRWLVVIDDLLAPSTMADLWPPRNGNGRTLITTRRRDAALVGEGRRFITVEPFTPTESVAYLTRKFAGHPERVEGADRLAEELGHLPVALAQAAAYIQDRGLTCNDYRRRLATRLAALADLLPESDALPDGQHVAVSATWSLSVVLADRLRPKGLARPLLEIAAFLDPNGIPLALFESEAVTAYVAARRPAAARSAGLQAAVAGDALGSLHRLNLVTVDQPGAVVRVHALVQRAARDGLNNPERRRAARAAADALGSLWVEAGASRPSEEALRSNALLLYRQAGDHLIRRGVHPLVFRITTSLGRCGQVSAALAHAHQVSDAAARLLGADHPDVLAARGDVAFWQGEAGAPSRAAAAAQRLVDECSQILGPEHRQTLTARHHVAGWHGRAGGPWQAVIEFQELLADRIRILGADDPDTLNNRNSLAGWRGYAGDAEGAVTELRAVLADRTRVLGPDHAETLDTRHHLAKWLGEAGDPAAAAAALSELLMDRQRLVGAEHRDTLATRYRLACWHAADGRIEEAVVEQQQLVEDCLRILGPAHPDTLTVQMALADLHGRRGVPELAVATLEAVLAGQRQVLERDHPSIRRTSQELAKWKRVRPIGRAGPRPAVRRRTAPGD
jgi:transcriptional regulator with XRE-family HTH domain